MADKEGNDKTKSGENASTLKEVLEAREMWIQEEGLSVPHKEEPRGRPQPPTQSKEKYMQIANLGMFPEIEKHMRSVPDIPNNLTFNQLASQLFLEKQFELEIARSIFMWIVFQDLRRFSKINFPASLNDDSVLAYFRDIVNGRKSLAHLYARIATQAGLHVKTITGFIKGANWFPDHTFSDDKDPNKGFWNAVFIEGCWRFIDVRSALPDDVFESEQPNKTWEEFYFLTDPADLICSHYPEDKKWQILPSDRSVTLKDFQNMPKKWPMYFSCAAELPNNLTSLIKVPNSGHIQIEFTVPHEIRKTESYKCELLTREGLRKKDGDIRLTTYVLHHTQGDRDVIQVFCPKKCEYILELYVMSTIYETNVYSIISILQLSCSETVEIFNTPLKPPFPKICDYYGLSPVAIQQGITKESPDVIVQCDDFGVGKLTIFYNKPALEVEATEEDKNTEGEATEEDKNTEGEAPEEPPPQPPKTDNFFEIVQNLYDALADQEEPSRDCVVQCSCVKEERTEVTFLIRVPHEGHFALILYYNNSKKLPEYVDFGHFLVTWKKPSGFRHIEKCFPHVKQGKLGPVQASCESLGIELVDIFPSDTNTPNIAWVVPEESGEALLCFQHTSPLMFITQKVDEEVETNIECTSTHSFITVRTAPKQNYKTFILRVYADVLGKVEMAPLVYIFMFMVTRATNISAPLPKCPNHYWGGVRNKLDEFKAVVKRFTNSESYMLRKFFIKEYPMSDVTPCRLYRGGDDMQLELEHTAGPYAIRPVLRLMVKGKPMNIDQNCLSITLDFTNIAIRARFPKRGTYVLGLFCDKIGGEREKMNFVPFYFCFIAAESPSWEMRPFPKSFPMWSTTCHQLMKGFEDSFFQPSTRADYRIKLNNFKRDKKTGVCEEVHVDEVVLLLDDWYLITAKPGPPGTYAWTYMTESNSKKMCVGVLETKGTTTNVVYCLEYTFNH